MTKCLNKNFICPRCDATCEKYIGKTLTSFRCMNCITDGKNTSFIINFNIDFYDSIYNFEILIGDKRLLLSDDRCHIYDDYDNLIYSSNENYLSEIDLENIIFSSKKLINKLLILKEFL